jgi:hypothetical protein
MAAFLLEDIRFRGTAERPELEVDERPVLVHGINDLPRNGESKYVSENAGRFLSEGRTNRQPPLNLLVVPYARRILVPGSLCGDEGRLGDS